jgi:hypothetical protein
MKVVPQIIIFIIVLGAGWFTYERHDAFRQLVDDITDYAGFDESSGTQVSSSPEVAVADTSQPEAVEAATDEQPPAVSPVSEAAPVTLQQQQSEDEKPVVQAAQMETPEAQTTDMPGAADIAPADEGIVWPEAEKAGRSTAADDQAQARPDTQSAGTADVADEPVDRSAQSAPSEIQEQPVQSESSGQTEPASRPDANSQEPVKVEPDTGGAAQATQQPDETATPPEGAAEQQLPVGSKPQQQSTAPMPANSSSTEKQTNVDQQAIMAQRKREAQAGLALARSAWHQGNHDKAISLYWRLLREFSNHPDFAGELGNIYFSQGQTELAVNAYSEAFLRLLKNNDREGAMQVLRIVYNIDQEQAALLREYLPSQ